MKTTKQKIIEILATAFISAGIAFLQGILATFFNQPNIHSNIALAGGIGATIHSIRIFT